MRPGSDPADLLAFSGPEALSSTPVSYTHLDVYKRQVYANDVSEFRRRVAARVADANVCLLYTSRCV